MHGIYHSQVSSREQSHCIALFPLCLAFLYLLLSLPVSILIRTRELHNAMHLDCALLLLASKRNWSQTSLGLMNVSCLLPSSRCLRIIYYPGWLTAFWCEHQKLLPMQANSKCNPTWDSLRMSPPIYLLLHIDCSFLQLLSRRS